MAGNPIKPFVDRVVRQAKDDPKKATVLGVLITVMAVMWARVVGGGAGGPGPSPASAMPAGYPGAPGAATGPNNVRLPVRTNPGAAPLMEWARRPIAPLSRNLFVVNYDFFPQDGSRPAEPTVRIARGDGFWDQLAKSMAVRADQIKEHRARVDRLRAEAAKLKVQSTMMGASPKALVDGRLVGLGDVVASFRVTKIEARRIVVEREGIQFALRFN